MAEKSKDVNPSVGSSFDDFLKDEGVYEEVTAQSIKQVNGWKFKDDQEVTRTSEPWYDLTDGGYMKPHSMLENSKDADDVVEAVALIMSFFDAAVEAGVLEYT